MANTTTPGTSDAPEGPLTTAALLARVDAGWAPFREAVRHLGRARLDEPTGAGWSFHDLIAHVAGWHDLTARRLRHLRTTGVRPGPGDEAAIGVPAFRDADELNARIVASHRLVGPEALVDELDTTQRALREEIAQLSDDQVAADDGWVAAVVAANTFGHYAEHAKELGAG